MSQYTKGEWNVQLAQPYDEHEFEVSYDTPDGLTFPIADVHGKLEYGDVEANAHLIAAAPDMHHILTGLINDPNHFCLLPPHYKQAISEVLSKAKGGK
uniref:Uncharacterized protein n=2 Tax=viral metagenome TaxID=1070528 RepID=A0A6H2A3G1_9ZZZZ